MVWETVFIIIFQLFVTSSENRLYVVKQWTDSTSTLQQNVQPITWRVFVLLVFFRLCVKTKQMHGNNTKANKMYTCVEGWQDRRCCVEIDCKCVCWSVWDRRTRNKYRSKLCRNRTKQNHDYDLNKLKWATKPEKETNCRQTANIWKLFLDPNVCYRLGHRSAVSVGIAIINHSTRFIRYGERLVNVLGTIVVRKRITCSTRLIQKGLNTRWRAEAKLTANPCITCEQFSFTVLYIY